VSFVERSSIWSLNPYLGGSTIGGFNLEVIILLTENHVTLLPRATWTDPIAFSHTSVTQEQEC